MEAPVGREAAELAVGGEPRPLEPEVAQDHGAHLIEEQLGRDAAEGGEGGLEASKQRRHILARIEAEPQQPGIAEHDEQGVAHAPRQAKAGEVDLGLFARRSLEAAHGLRGWLRSHPVDEASQLREAALVARGSHLREEADRRQLRKLRQASLDEGLIGIQFRRHRWPRVIVHITIENPLELAGRNPVVDGPAADAQPFGDR